MKTFEVEDDLIELVWKLAKPEPFESLSFSAALRKVLAGHLSGKADPKTDEKSLDDWINEILAGQKAGPKKAPTPDASEWASSIPELKSKKSLNSWKAICDELHIDPAGDSARRKLKTWVKDNRPQWPPVPEPAPVNE